jgi:TPR repeat protein
MRVSSRRLLVALLVAGSVPGTAFAAPLQDGALAYSRGDYGQAITLLRPVAAGGDALAQIIVGYLYSKGQGVTKDEAEGARWFKLAAEQGSPEGEAAFGLECHDGLGVARDYAQALHWLRLSAAQGNEEAQNALGRMYEHGEGVAADKEEALSWYKLAAAKGDSDAAKAVERLSQDSGK